MTGVTFVAAELGAKHLDCCMSCSRKPWALACWSIPTSPRHSPLSRTFRLRPRPSGSKSKSSRLPPAVTLIRSLRTLCKSRSWATARVSEGLRLDTFRRAHFSTTSSRAALRRASGVAAWESAASGLLIRLLEPPLADVEVEGDHPNELGDLDLQWRRVAEACAASRNGLASVARPMFSTRIHP